MDKILKLNWWGAPENGKAYANNNLIFSMIVLIFITLVLSILIYIAIRRQKTIKAPNAPLMLVETIIISSDDFISETHERKFDRANPYLISLFVFFFFGNVVSLFGFAPIGSSISAVLAATAVTWLGTLTVGFIYNKFRHLAKLLNPLEIVSTISPIISLTFRMFGNILGGLVLITLSSLFLNNIWSKILGVPSDSAAAEINPFGVLILPSFNLYFDLFDDLIQAGVFMILTISYWQGASEVEVKEKHKKKIKELKELIVENNNQENQVDTKINLTT
ncbi:F0F1 ATP synthase subunit A [[Mycoplasma] phocae]|uniref:F0F1 ATP synthase subunit A n=1 Tax=[Mycoplasma] phocae TaxID=142651 RepID=A0A2Z5IPM8_9BACT|nr:F0F1 ATP synthase subunit A [[Mycoplasma] phocae]AXE60575.1 F0F1 ATP synthase subunit A [[Mycoplasma] phocae]